jgi:DNA-binding response OmpR family regulator
METFSKKTEMVKRVLVVDDEPAILKFINIKLKLNGYEVVNTVSGAEAVEIIRTQSPDIMLLDILMPGVTGLDVLEKVRTFSNIPIVVFTGRPDVAKLALKLGASDYIAKPFNPDLLLEKIAFVLDPSQIEKGFAKTRKKVLVVDDERAILKVFSIKLRISGYDVITASNGREALELFKKESPDIMLLDVIMPGLDGFEVLQSLRSFSKVPVIVFSAMPENAQKALNLGADEFLAKPFNVDEIVKKITRLLHQKAL